MSCCSTLDSDKITSLLTVFVFEFTANFVVSRCPHAALFANFKGVLGFSVSSIILVTAGLMQITM